MNREIFAGIWVVTALFAFTMPIMLVDAFHTDCKKECDRLRICFSTVAIALFALITMLTGMLWETLVNDGVLLLFGFFGFVRAYNNARKDIVVQLKAADELGQFGLEHFKELDHNGDGLVDSADLCHPDTSRRLTTLDSRALDRLKLFLSKIGHAIGEDRPETVWSAGQPAPRVASLQDFASYHDRMQKRWADWLIS